MDIGVENPETMNLVLYPLPEFDRKSFLHVSKDFVKYTLSDVLVFQFAARVGLAKKVRKRAVGFLEMLRQKGGNNNSG